MVPLSSWCYGRFLALLLILFTAGSASAPSLFFDPAESDWDTTSIFWSTTSGGPFNTTWTNGNVANFTPNSLSTVTLDPAFNPEVTGIETGASTSANLTLAEDAAGNTILIGASGINHQAGGNDLFIQTDIELTATQTWQSAGGGFDLSGNLNLSTFDLDFQTGSTDHTLSGDLTGSGNIAISGGSTTTFEGDLTSWTGDFDLGGGTNMATRLEGPLNSASNVVQSGSHSLEINGQTLTLTNDISLSTRGKFNQGGIRSQGGSNLTLDGTISIVDSTGLYVTSGSTMNVDGGIELDSSVTGGEQIRFGGDGEVNFNSVISDSSAAGTLNLFFTMGSDAVVNMNANHTFDNRVQIGGGTVNVDTVADSGVASGLGAGNQVRFGQNFGTDAVGVLEIDNSSSSNRTFRFEGSDNGTADTNGGAIDVATGQTVTLSGSIDRGGDSDGIARFEKRGGGLLLLSNAGGNSFDGQVYVQEGTLVVNTALNDVTGISGLETFVQVESGGTLAGTGEVTDIRLQDGGIIAPGNSPGEFTAASLDWNPGGTLAFELGLDDTTANSDLLTLSGALTKATAGSPGDWQFAFSDGTGGPTIGQTYTLIDFDSQSGFAASDFDFTYSGANPLFDGSFNLTGSSLEFNVTAIPEPGSLSLILLAATGLLFRRARRSVPTDS